jgi:CRISPR-associated protein Cmr1
MTSPKTLTATFQVVTPLFLGGADGQAEGFRLASLKGTLRWWWRALHYADFMREAQGSRGRALAELHRSEARLFGSADEGQAAFLMRLESPLAAPTILAAGALLKDGGGRVAGSGACYLGYGLMTAFGANRGRLDRSCICAGQAFTVSFRMKPRADGLNRAEFSGGRFG